MAALKCILCNVTFLRSDVYLAHDCVNVDRETLQARIRASMLRHPATPKGAS